MLKKCVLTIKTFWIVIEIQIKRFASVFDLLARLYIANIFFLSGKNKFQDWETTLYLFTDEYHVPFLPPTLAAISATAGELGLSIMLAIGLFTRFSAIGLFVINIVAFFSYYQTLITLPVAVNDHITWGIILGLLTVTNIKQLTLERFLFPRIFN